MDNVFGRMNGCHNHVSRISLFPQNIDSWFGRLPYQKNVYSLSTRIANYLWAGKANMYLEYKRIQVKMHHSHLQGTVIWYPKLSLTCWWHLSQLLRSQIPRSGDSGINAAGDGSGKAWLISLCKCIVPPRSLWLLSLGIYYANTEEVKRKGWIQLICIVVDESSSMDDSLMSYLCQYFLLYWHNKLNYLP